MAGNYRDSETLVTLWLAEHGLTALRMSLGFIYVWFGVLKFFPGLSPAQDIAVKTMEAISFDLVSHSTYAAVLATWETLIGVGLISGRFMRITLALLLLQMAGTFVPLVLFPREVFSSIPFVPTLEGQYIVKNLVIIASALVLGSTVRGGRVISDPDIADRAKRKEQAKLRLVADRKQAPAKH